MARVKTVNEPATAAEEASAIAELARSSGKELVERDGATYLVEKTASGLHIETRVA